MRLERHVEHNSNFGSKPKFRRPIASTNGFADKMNSTCAMRTEDNTNYRLYQYGVQYNTHYRAELCALRIVIVFSHSYSCAIKDTQKRLHLLYHRISALLLESQISRSPYKIAKGHFKTGWRVYISGRGRGTQRWWERIHCDSMCVKTGVQLQIYDQFESLSHNLSLCLPHEAVKSCEVVCLPVMQIT